LLVELPRSDFIRTLGRLNLAAMGVLVGGALVFATYFVFAHFAWYAFWVSPLLLLDQAVLNQASKRSLFALLPLKVQLPCVLLAVQAGALVAAVEVFHQEGSRQVVFAIVCLAFIFEGLGIPSRALAARGRELALARHQLHAGQTSLMARLEEAEEARADIIAAVSHELRTPLAGIRGSLATLRRRRHRMSDEQLDSVIGTALSSADRLSRLLENMLTVATEADSNDNNVSDLPAVVQEALGSMSAAGAVAVAVDLPNHLSVRMSRQALHQVVEILVDSAARRALPGTTVRLVAGVVGSEAVLRVSNLGPDLDRNTILRLFEPFAQRDEAVTTPSDDGMSLYIVRRLVEVHGGRLRMASVDGETHVEVDILAAESAGGEATETSATPATERILRGLPPLPIEHDIVPPMWYEPPSTFELVSMARREAG
jgi:signal transduction histidine kinase